MHLFIVLFLSVLSSLLSTIYAAPYQHTSLPLYRRITYNIQGKSAVTGKQLSDKEHTKSTVYRLDTWDNISNPGYVLKKYNTQSKTHVVNNEIYCLEAVGQLVAHDEDQKIIVMKEAEGETLTKVLTPFKGAERKTKVNQWRTDVAKVVADIAEKNGVFNCDLNENNIMISGTKITIIDWEHCAKREDEGFLSDPEKIWQKLELWDSSGPLKSTGKA